MMKPLILAAAMCCAGASFAADPSGVWQTEPSDTGGRLHVTLAPCGAAICGTIKTAFDGDKKVIDDYEHAGRQMIEGMTASSDTKWGSGTIWAPDQDKTYRAKMELLSDDQLKVSGCVAGGLICRGQTWVRVK